MKVAIMFSGGKDSTFAIDYAREKGMVIDYLLSVKPSRKDCFLFHYATVEHTPKMAEMLGLKHILIGCDVADPEQEAQLVRNVVEKNPVDAVILGGTGSQETQLRSIQKALLPLHIEVFAAHAGNDHEEVFKEMLDRGYEIMITQIASDGLLNWLGKKITKDNFAELKKDSEKFGFHIGFEGGYADTLCLDAPFFSAKLEPTNVQKVIEDEYNGHVVAEIAMVKKVEVQ